MKTRRHLGLALVCLAMGSLIFCVGDGLPFIGMGGTQLYYPIGWLGIVGPLIALTFVAVKCQLKDRYKALLLVLGFLAIVELAIFIRITCIAMSLTAFGPWGPMERFSELALPFLVGLGVLCWLSLGKATNLAPVPADLKRS